MPFIGKQPQAGAYSKLDAITTSATATYNLTLDSGAYYPQSANHLLVSLNGVIQAPQDSFTVSGSQIIFDSALTSADVIDFIIALGDTLDIGVPSAGSVNTSQLANDAVTTAKIAAGAVDTTELASGAVTSAKLDTNIAITGDLTVDTNTLKVDSSSNTVGIGELSPQSILHVTSTSPRITMTDTNTGADHRINADSGAGNLAFDVDYNSETSAPSVVFNLKGSEKLRILNGGGITFNGDTAAANALHDYEEGSWTPNIGADATYSNQQGIYTKIGRYVSAAFDITINARNSGSTGQMFGLPFTVNNGVTPVLGVSSGHISYYSSLAQNVYSLDMYAINGQTYVYFTGHTIASGNIGNALPVFGNSTRIVGTVHYYAN